MARIEWVGHGAEANSCGLLGTSVWDLVVRQFPRGQLATTQTVYSAFC